MNSHVTTLLIRSGVNYSPYTVSITVAELLPAWLLAKSLYDPSSVRETFELVSDSRLSEKEYLASAAVLMLVVPELLMNCHVMSRGDTGG